MPPSVYFIPFDAPFLDTLVAGLMDSAGTDPLALARMTVLVPTRRAARSLREAFLRAGDGKALLLPHLVPVGDLDPEELAFLADESDAGDAGFDLPPAVPELQRRLLLTRLVGAFASRQGRPLALGQAAALARELARFLDEVQSEGCDPGRLADLAPGKYARHWQDILKFLAIVTSEWPKLLAGLGCLDPAERRNQLLAAQIEAWRKEAPRATVIAAGITGGIPAVVDLLVEVASLPRGAVVLPGLDRDADGAMWEEIRQDPAHPQHLMARFLDRVALEPREVKPWAGGATTGPRQRFVSEAFAPAGLTHRWRFLSGVEGQALQRLKRLDCAGPQEEALAIALLLREKLETPGATAALVTPDRDLARRVAAELRRWSIDIDDSAGLPLNRTPPGVFLRLALDLAASQLAPLPLLSALKHPLAACGMPRPRFRELVRKLELAALRGPRPGPGIAGLRDALPGSARDLLDLVRRVEIATAPLVAALESGDQELSEIVAAHIAACEALAASDIETGPAVLWREPAGEAAAQFLNELLDAARGFPRFVGAEYPALFEALLAGPVVRPPYGRHPRLFIWGLLEARLQQAALIVLGGLNEGVWPATADGDPWLSRPMRQDFGMAPPERRIGMAALDFTQALGAREVVMTRATRVEGTPTVPSRWLLRLDTLLRAVGREGALAGDGEPLVWQDRLDAPVGPARPLAPPEARPKVEARPRRLSVTEIETWRRDPYAIYARHTLRLKALEPIDADPGAAERGIFIHAALARFLHEFPKQLPRDAFERLLVAGQQSFGEALERPGVWAFWWPRFRRIAAWALTQEAQRRPELEEIFAELSGRLVIEGPRGSFELTGRADRLERRRDGKIAVIDYKTGTVPGRGDFLDGYAPQLPLEAAMVENGGFAELGRAAVEELAYWRLSGGEIAGEMKLRECDRAKLRQLIDGAVTGLKDLVTAFDDPATPYRAVPVPAKAPRYSDYEHFERVKEWLAGPELEE